jgi:hypothetical protein
MLCFPVNSAATVVCGGGNPEDCANLKAGDILL